MRGRKIKEGDHHTTGREKENKRDGLGKKPQRFVRLLTLGTKDERGKRMEGNQHGIYLLYQIHGPGLGWAFAGAFTGAH